MSEGGLESLSVPEPQRKLGDLPPVPSLSTMEGLGPGNTGAPGNFLAQLQPRNGFILLLLGFCIFLVPALTLPLSRGEAFYALVPSEMLAAGRWMGITLNGAPFLDKPHLPFWLNLMAFKVWGVSDWAARLPTLALTMAEIWMTFRLGCLLLSPRAAWLGGFILLSSSGFFYLHLQLFADHFITLSLILALYFMLRWFKEPRRRWGWLLHLSMGLGFLGKGIIGLGFPFVIGFIYAWHLGQLRRFRQLFLHAGGLALLALIMVSWFGAMERAYPGFLWHYFIDEHLNRFLGHRQPGGVSTISIPLLWFFLGIWLLPWTFLLPQALYRYFKETRLGDSDQEKMLLIIWPAVVLAVFTLSSTRIEYYTLPALPPLALLLGWRVERYLASPTDRSLPLAFLALALLAVVGTFFMLFLQKLCVGNRREFLGIFPLIQPVTREARHVILFLTFLGALGGWRRRYLALAVYGILALSLLFCTFQALTAIIPVRCDKLAGEYVRHHAAPGDLVIMESFEEAELVSSFVFYARHSVLMVQRHGLPRFLYPVGPQENYLIPPSKLKELWYGPRRVFLLVDDAMPLEPYLKDAQVAQAGGGKSLLVNRLQ
jgi:4-amino-4-deoxy-L-arabinose transferase-like glycosyltransferase